MCVTMPGQVIAIDAQGATVEMEGRRRRASTVLVPDIAMGEWVLVAMGTIIERLPADVASEMRSVVREALGPEPDASGRGVRAAGRRG